MSFSVAQALAEELELPLIEVPETVTYLTIIIPPVGAILREQTFLVRRAVT